MDTKKNSEQHNNYFDKVISGILRYQFYNQVDDAELANKSGLSVSTIQKIKQKKHFPTMSTLKKLKKAGIVLPITFDKNIFNSSIPIVSKPP